MNHLILIDLDGTIADFNGRMTELFTTRYPTLPWKHDRDTFDFDPLIEPLTRNIMSEPGFFKSLKPITGAIEAVHSMLHAGHDVFFCTSPVQSFQHCVVEKYEWIEQYFGANGVKRIILTKDKTLVQGDYLIDDKPEIRGAESPKWEHILFDQPYNRYIKNKKRLMQWSDWPSILTAPLELSDHSE